MLNSQKMFVVLVQTLNMFSHTGVAREQKILGPAREGVTGQ
jgi:hypothetical protein